MGLTYSAQHPSATLKIIRDENHGIPVRPLDSKTFPDICTREAQLPAAEVSLLTGVGAIRRFLAGF